MNLALFLKELGLDDKEITIFTTLAKLWIQPASTIARNLGMERTTVYKILLRLSDQGLVSQTQKGWVTHFFLPDPSVLRKTLITKKESLLKLEDTIDIVENELISYQPALQQTLPKISLFDGNEWITNLYQDILSTTLDNKYLVIKFFASNTFQNQVSVNARIINYYHDLFEKLHKHKITIESYLWNWILIMEQIMKTTNIQNLHQLPAGNSAINMFLVGKSFYLVIFKDNPFWIKIESEEFTNVLHFLFEKLQTA